MSLRLRRIEVTNFRKFREPMVVEGMANGLNIVIEPNESGKSTLLEALRAAFFVRFGTKNQRAQSYAPLGDAVAPEVKVDFEVGDAPWSVTKRFLKGAMIEVSGPQGRAQGDEAEDRLHALLGSVRDASRGGDASTNGALGLLWVAQTDALSVEAPGAIVRDSIRSTLEAEVGSIMGGTAYKRVYGRVDEQFGRYWTPTGQKRGLQNEARARLDKAELAAREATAQLAGLEKTFADLDAARARLRSVQREIADNADAQVRADLVRSLDVASAAAQILATRLAEQEAARARVHALEDLDERHRSATGTHQAAERALIEIQGRGADLAQALDLARRRQEQAREAFDGARAAHREARAALAAGEERLRTVRRKAAVASARGRHDQLVGLEQQLSAARALAATLIPAATLASLEADERDVAQAQAFLSAGATRIRVEGDAERILLDGQPLTAGERTITRETRLRFGAAEVIVIPPPKTVSAEEALASALRKQQAALAELGIADVASARARNDEARGAAGELRTIEARIEAATTADEHLGLARGADALKAFIASLEPEEGERTVGGDLPDLPSLTEAWNEAGTTMARAEGAQESAMDALRQAEREHVTLATTEAGIISDVANAAKQIQQIEERPGFASLTADLAQARMHLAEAGVRLSEAQRDATAHDQVAIKRKIETIDARTTAAAETRTKLEKEIVWLEGAVHSEGGKGLADRAAAAGEEVDAARLALHRVSEDAEVLKLLHDTLDEARNETSAKFVGPVAKRAKRYIDRLLPGSDLVFSEDLALETVVRGGVAEACGNLSRGTQEQLSVLTRIAFADLLLAQGQPVSLILDDPFVYSDDARLDVMIDILSEASERMQVLLLTCRDRAFRHVPGTRLVLTAPRSANEVAS